jgi:hypothetical protein
VSRANHRREIHLSQSSVVSGGGIAIGLLCSLFGGERLRHRSQQDLTLNVGNGQY